MPKVHVSGRGSKLGTLTKIQTDRLTKTSEKNWARTPAAPFSSDLVKEIYENEIMRAEGKASIDHLEASQYLEKYLWPNFHRNPSATFEHVMSMIIMLNEKFRKNVEPWTCFRDRIDVFEKFLERVLKLRHDRGTASFSVSEKTAYLLFFTNSLQRFEDKLVRKKVSSFAGMMCWHSLSDGGRVKLELTRNPSLVNSWKRLADRAKDWKSSFLRNLIEDFLMVLGSEVFFTSNNIVQVNEACLLYCERVMEFLVYLLNPLSTEKLYVRVLVSDIGVVEKCRASDLYTHERGQRFSQLVDSLKFFGS